MSDAHDPLSQLQHRGLAKFDSMIAPGLIAEAYAMICDLAAEHGIFVGESWASSEDSFSVPKPFRKALNRLNRSAGFPHLLDGHVQAEIEDLLGEPVEPLPPGQQMLFTLPGQSNWAVPHGVWHLDMPRLGNPEVPGLQAFALLQDIEPGGGGTLVVAGSHRLLEDYTGPSKQVKRALSQEPYFANLFDPARPPLADLEDTRGRVGEVNLEVAELCGEAGDVFLMDLRVLHTPAPNCSERPRIMLTCRYPKASVAAALQGAG